MRSFDPINILNIKLKRFKTFFKGWGSSKFGHEKKRKKRVTRGIGEFRKDGGSLGDLSPDLFCKRTDICVELNGILGNEELY